MPTAKPRLMLTLRPTLYATVKRLAELNGRPMSSTLLELIEGIEPILQKVVSTLEQVRNLEGVSRARLLARVTQQQGELEETAALVLGQFEMFKDDLAKLGAEGRAAGKVVDQASKLVKKATRKAPVKGRRRRRRAKS